MPKSAENRKMRGKCSYPNADRGCSTLKVRSQEKSKKQMFFLHCSSNLTIFINHCNNFSCYNDILICDVINGCRSTNFWFN